MDDISNSSTLSFLKYFKNLENDSKCLAFIPQLLMEIFLMLLLNIIDLNNSKIPSLLSIFLFNSISSILGSNLIGLIIMPEYKSLIPASESSYIKGKVTKFLDS